MKKRGLLVGLLALAMALTMAVLSGCNQGSASASASKSSETFDIKSETVTESPVELRTDPFYVMIVGNDSRKDTVGLHGQYKSDADGSGRSDTLMLVRVDPKKYTFNIITVPRDTATEYQGEKVKLNEVFKRGGIEDLKQAVKDLTGVMADYYIITTFGGFENLVDGMGGITADVPINLSMQDIVSGDQIDYSAGTQELDGAQTLVFARERHFYEIDQDAYRQSNDRYILRVMIQTLLSMPDKLGDLVENVLYNYVTSDLSAAELAAYAEDFADNADKVAFTSCTGPYSGDVDYETGDWLAYRDEETWANVINAVETGGDPTEFVPILVYGGGAASDVSVL